MKHFGTFVPIVLLLGSMKLVEYKALTSSLHKDSISFRTHIEADIEPELVHEKPYQYSLIPSISEEMPEPDILLFQDEPDTEPIDILMAKMKKLYVLRRIIANNQPTDIVPDYPLEEELAQEESVGQIAYSIDAIPAETSARAVMKTKPIFVVLFIVNNSDVSAAIKSISTIANTMADRQVDDSTENNL